MRKRVLSAITAAGLLGTGGPFLGCASTRTRESAGEYVDDSAITAKVKAAILQDPALKSLQISVKTYKGVVQLSGFVDSKDMVEKAGKVAGQVSGVRDVKNSLTVK
ncbi:BON domain-containing protein [Anaeromyxobacter oryzisoli]|uniref:BON domain-containing protein n=1 Tax=Anaeromyxobacter oryzisoli TaxID=2925408 RepID=UPI001F57BCCE|nr:BON domain-containing protein [Anaeromyxobacter sp. SG63]